MSWWVWEEEGGGTVLGGGGEGEEEGRREEERVGEEGLYQLWVWCPPVLGTGPLPGSIAHPDSSRSTRPVGVGRTPRRSGSQGLASPAVQIFERQG